MNIIGRPAVGVGKNNNQGIGKSREANAQEGNQSAARWRLPTPTSNKENAGQSAAKERDLRHHLSEVSKQVSKMPTRISKLLEEAVRFLDSSQASKQGTLAGGNKQTERIERLFVHSSALDRVAFLSSR